MKKIIYILMILVLIGSVSGYLGEELVTCWDFTCDDDWVGFTPAIINWTFATGNLARYLSEEATHTLNNLSQDIVIKPNTNYNVTLNIDSSSKGSPAGNIELKYFLGGVEQLVLSDVISGTPIIYSFVITTINTDGLFLQGNASNSGILNIDTISVKEIIQPPNKCIVQLKKARETITEQNRMIVQLKRDKEAIQNGIRRIIVQLKILLKI